MSQEITITVAAALTNGDLKDSFAPGADKIDQAVKGKHCTIWLVGTSDEAFTMGSDITAAGWVYLQNLDPTNYVEFGPTSGGAIVKLIKLMPGESAVFRMAGSVTLRGIANTGACRVAVGVYDT